MPIMNELKPHMDHRKPSQVNVMALSVEDADTTILKMLKAGLWVPFKNTEESLERPPRSH